MAYQISNFKVIYSKVELILEQIETSLSTVYTIFGLILPIPHYLPSYINALSTSFLVISIVLYSTSPTFLRSFLVSWYLLFDLFFETYSSSPFLMFDMLCFFHLWTLLTFLFYILFLCCFHLTSQDALCTVYLPDSFVHTLVVICLFVLDTSFSSLFLTWIFCSSNI